MRFSFNFYSLFFLLFCLTSCGQDNKNSDAVEKLIYTLKIQSANPYETYVNDTPLEKDHNTGTTDFELIINDLLQKNANQKIKAVIFHKKDEKFLRNIDINYFIIKIILYEGMNNYYSQNGKIIKEFHLKNNENSNLPIISNDFLVELDVPFNLTSWSSSQDLSKENQEELKKEVVAMYKSVQNIINKGDIKSFYEINKTRDKEVYTSLYNDEKTIQDDKQYISDRLTKSKGNIKELKDYQMKLYNNGKTVTLELSNGETPLYAEDSEEIYTYFILLHRPKAGAPLEIIR